jgi:hypothetical protein
MRGGFAQTLSDPLSVEKTRAPRFSYDQSGADGRRGSSSRFLVAGSDASIGFEFRIWCCAISRLL